MAITLNGTTGIQNVLGSAAAPAESNTTSSNTGVYFPTSTSVGIATAGVNAVTVDASQNVTMAGTATATKLIPTGTSVTGNGMYLPATNALGFSTAGAEAMRIDSSGNLLVGTTSQQAIVTANATSASSNQAFWGKNSGGATNPTYVAWNNSTAGDNSFMTFYTETSATLRGSISYNRGAGLVSYNVTSDYRAKTVNGPVVNALSKLSLLKPSTGRMNGAAQDIDFFVAHELQAVVPSAVTGEKDAVNEDNTPKYQMVDKSAIIPLLTAAIQEQQALITSLTDRIAALEAK